MATRHSTTPGLIPAAGYLRRSTSKQEKSLAEQKAEILTYAAEHGYQIVSWYIDDGISGDATEKRLDFQRMIADASGRRDFEAILCWDQDRFGRFDSMEAGYWIHPLRKAGVKLVTVADGPVDWEDFSGRMVYSIKQEGKHQFLHDLAKRVTRGMKTTAAAGGWNGGPVPFGFDRGEFTTAGDFTRRLLDGEKHRKGCMVKLIPSDDPAKLEAVRFAFDRFATADVSLRQLARELDAKGYPSPTDRGWNHAGLAEMLRKPIYTGTSRWGGRSYGKYAPVADAIEQAGTFEPIIDRATFDRVQKRLAKGTRKKSARRAEYPLRGLLFCAHCGLPMIGTCVRRPGGYTYHKYLCRSYGAGCGHHAVPARQVLGWLVPALQEVLIGPGREAVLAAVREELQARVEQAREAPQRLDTRLADLDGQIDRLRRAIARVDDVGLVEQLREAKRQREAVAAEAAQAGRFTTPEDVDREAERIVAHVFDLADALAEAEPATLRALLGELVYRIECRWGRRTTPSGRTRCPLIEGRVELRELPGLGLSGGVSNGTP